MARALALLLVLTVPAVAQSPCEARCNQLASECLKRCAGDPREASKPESAKKLMACLDRCEAEVKPCREACRR